MRLKTSEFLKFNVLAETNDGSAYAHEAEQPHFLVLDAEPAALMFVRHEVSEPDDVVNRSARDGSGAHGRFAAPGNAVRRHVQVRAISPRTADELAGFFRDVSYTLTDIRQGEAVPPYKVDRVPADLGNKDGNERKMLFITALLPVILEVNQRVLADREQLLYLRDKLYSTPQMLTAIERIWLEDLAERYDAPVEKIAFTSNRSTSWPGSRQTTDSPCCRNWRIAARSEGSSDHGARMTGSGRPRGARSASSFRSTKLKPTAGRLRPKTAPTSS